MDWPSGAGAAGEAALDSRNSKHDLGAQLLFAQERLEKISGLTGRKSFGTVFDPDENLENWHTDIEEQYGAKPTTTGLHRLNLKLRDRGLRPMLALIVGPVGGFKTTLALH